MEKVATLTETERRALIALHIKGCIGSMGSMKISQRQALLQSLLERGYITEKLEVTQKALDELRHAS